MLEKQAIAYLKYAHALYNTGVMLLFFYHGWLGLTIRRRRLQGGELPRTAVKRHRRSGPVLAVMAALGFSVGITLVMIDKGNLFEYPLHLFTGLTIMLLLWANYRISRRIAGPDAPYRKPHFIIGIAILCLYCIEAFLGLGILL